MRSAKRYRDDAAGWARTGRHDLAADLYALALELQPDDLDVQTRLAQCLVLCERPLAAARCYLELARGHVAQRCVHAALAAATRILELCPEHFSADEVSEIVLAIGTQAIPVCRDAARVHHEAGRDDQTAALLRLCGHLSPHDAEPWCELATLYRKHQMWAEAAWALRRAAPILRNNESAGPYVECLRGILWLEPEDLDARRELPRFLVRIGRPELALSELGALLRMAPGDEAGLEIMAHAFAMLGRLEACVTIVQQRAHALSARGLRSEARGLLTRARGWRPNDPVFMDELRSLRRQPPPSTVSSTQRKGPSGMDSTLVLDLTSSRFGARTTATPDDQVFDATELVEVLDESPPPVRARKRFVLRPPICPPARASMVKR